MELLLMVEHDTVLTLVYAVHKNIESMRNYYPPVHSLQKIGNFVGGSFKYVEQFFTSTSKEECTACIVLMRESATTKN